jgi:hypothetical protein
MMFRSTIGRSAAIVSTLAGLALGGGISASRAVDAMSLNGGDMAARPNFETLKTIPLISVVETAARGYTLLLPMLDDSAPPFAKENSDKALAKINDLDPELRRLVWLTWILSCWGSEDNEGLHTFFFLWGGDYASETLDALTESGLPRQAAIFREAMAAFGPNYPVRRSLREKFFAWSQPGTRIDETTSIPQPLNAFDKKLMALSASFGSRADYRRAIEEVVRRTPKLLAWADQARGKISDQERLQWLTEHLWVDTPEGMAKRIPTWPAAYRQLYLLDLFNGEMLNGGVHQFFSNSSGNLAQEVVIALHEANLPKHADAVQKGVEMFDTPYPVDRQNRGRYFFVNGETTEWDNRLDALTADVDDGAIGAAMLAIAKREGLLPQ